MKIGDLIYMSKSMLLMGYPEVGTVIGVKARCYVIGFPSGMVQPFDPRWVSKKPIEGRKK